MNIYYVDFHLKYEMDLLKKYIALLKKLNPELNISAKWIKSDICDCVTVIMDKPYETLKKPFFYKKMQEYFSKITEEEYFEMLKEEINKHVFLNYGIKVDYITTQGLIKYFKMANPEVDFAISPHDDYLFHLDCSIPYNELNFPEGFFHYDSFAIDKDGNLAEIYTGFIDYKMDESGEFREFTKRYFDGDDILYEAKKTQSISSK